MASVAAAQVLKCIYPALPNTERGKFIKLGADPAKKKFLYCNRKNVYIRDIEKADVCDIFSGHSYTATVAKYNKTGFYIASGDSSGKVLVWDTTQPEHRVASEIMAIGGALKDISWAPGAGLDSTLLAFGGEGMNQKARIVDAKSLNSRGDITGQAKAVNALAHRPVKPYCLVTASEDHKLAFFDIKPNQRQLSYKCTISDHENFVNCVRYSPNGECFISGGADGKSFIYNGETAEKMGELVDDKIKGGKSKAHAAGVYGVEFKDDGSEIVTVSADKTAKIWNVEYKSLIGEYCFGKEILDMQVGCLWQGDAILSVSLSGFINYIDKDKPTNGTGFHTPLHVLKGHGKPIDSMAVGSDCGKLYTSSLDALGTTSNILGWDLNSGQAEDIQGKGHTSTVVDMTVVGDRLISVSVDDTLRYTSISANSYSSNICKLPSQPKGVAAIENKTVVACINHIVMVDGECNIVYQVEVKFEPSSVDISQDGMYVAVGGKADKHIHIFKVDGNNLSFFEKYNHGDEITDVQFSPDVTHLAAGTAGGRKEVILYDMKDEAEGIKQKYNEVKHTAKINSVSWSPNSRYFASGSLDGSVTIWKTTAALTNSLLSIKGAHVKGQVQKVCWLSDDIIATCSDDCNIKQFNLSSHL